MRKKHAFFVALASIPIILCALYGTLPRENDKMDSGESAAELLNHARTYYYFAREKGSTIYELEKAIAYAEAAKARLQNPNDGYGAEDSLRYTAIAERIIGLANGEKEKCRETLNNFFPLFLEVTGKDGFKEEDRDDKGLGLSALTRVLEKLVDLHETGSSVPLRQKPCFSIISPIGTDGILREKAFEQLELMTDHHIISDHEFASITGQEIPWAQPMVPDSSSIRKLCAAFQTDEIGVFSISELDKVDRLNYVGARFSVYRPDAPKAVSRLYTETFVVNRNFNSVLAFKLPLTGLTVLLPFLAWFFIRRGKNNGKAVPWHRFLLSSAIAITVTITTIEILNHFMSPASGEYFDTDKAVVWRFLLIFCLIGLPPFITYITIGKLDNLITTFDSRIREFDGILAIILPSLFCLPMTLAYYSVLRYSLSPDLYRLILPSICLYPLSVIISMYLAKLFSLPQYYNKTVKYLLMLGLIVFFTTLYVAGQGLWAYTVDQGGFHTPRYAIPLALVLGFPLLKIITRLESGFRMHMNDLIKKDFMDSFSMFGEPIMPFIETPEFKHRKELFEKTSLTLISGQSGSGKRREIFEMIRDKDFTNIISIDFSLVPGPGQVHYYPFAYGFRHVFSYDVFNDQAEGTRVVSNVIGRVISSFTSAGEFLLDDSDVKPAPVDKVGDILTDFIVSHPKTLILFTGTDKISEQCFTLLGKLFPIPAREQGTGQCRQTDSLRFIFSFKPDFFYKKRLLGLVLNRILDDRDDLMIGDYRFNHETDFNEMVHNLDGLILVEPPKDFFLRFVRNHLADVNDQYLLLDLYSKADGKRYPGFIVSAFRRMVDDGFLVYDNGRYRIGSGLRKYNKPIHGSTGDSVSSELTRLEKTDIESYRVLKVCAYSANLSGYFQAGCVASISDSDELSVLKSLEKLSSMNFVSADIEYDWYFISDEIIHFLKEPENSGIYNTPHIAIEFKKRYIDHYVGKFRDKKGSMENPKWVHHLTLLADRLFQYQVTYCKEALEFNLFASDILLRKGISRLKESEEYLMRAIQILDICPGDDQPLSVNREDLDRKLMNLYIEENKLNEFKRLWLTKYDSIPLDMENRADLLLVFDFILFNIRAYEEEQWIGQARDYCKAISLNSSLEIHFQRRAQWYTLELEKPKSLDLVRLAALSERYEALLALLESDIHADGSNADLMYLKGELLNSLGGKIITDNILEKLDSDDHVTFGMYFSKALSLLRKRIWSEAEKLNIGHHDGERATDEHIMRKLAYDHGFSVDKRGLAFAFNFYLRLLLNTYELKGASPIRSFDIDLNSLIRIAELAVMINESVGDERGKILSSAYLGRIYEAKGCHKEAFAQFENCLYMAMPADRLQVTRSIDNMKSIFRKNGVKTGSDALKIGLEDEAARLNSYLETEAEIHLIRHFSRLDEAYIEHLLEHRFFKDRASIGHELATPGSKFDPSKWKNPKDLIKEIEKEISRKTLKRDLWGTGYFEITKGTSVGLKGVVSLSELDESTAGKKYKKYRSGHLVWHIPKQDFRETDTITVIMDDSGNRIKTAFPGEYAPPMPDCKQTEDSEREKFAASFWDTHAFIDVSGQSPQ